MSGGIWAQIAEKMHDATMDYASLASNLYNSKFQRQNARKALQHQMAFDKNGIQWRVNDAIQAGLHPLYALGANTQSAVQNMFSPNDFQSPSKGQLMDLSQFGALATEQARLSNENLRLQNEKLKLQNLSYEFEKSKSSRGSSVSVNSKVIKNPPVGFDQAIQNMFSFSRVGDHLEISPSTDINTDDLGAWFSYPRFFYGKWVPSNDDIENTEAWLNSPQSPYYAELKPDERWVSDWHFGSGNRFKKRTYNADNTSDFPVISAFEKAIREYYRYERETRANDRRYSKKGGGRYQKYNPVTKKWYNPKTFENYK